MPPVPLPLRWPRSGRSIRPARPSRWSAVRSTMPGKDGLAQLTVKESLVAGWNGPAIEQMRIDDMPEVTFSTFVISLASSALVHLGEVPNPETGGTETSLPLAKHSIDVLEMLRAKTENGLEEQERQLLESILYELRMTIILSEASSSSRALRLSTPAFSISSMSSTGDQLSRAVSAIIRARDCPPESWVSWVRA